MTLPIITWSKNFFLYILYHKLHNVWCVVSVWELDVMPTFNESHSVNSSPPGQNAAIFQTIFKNVDENFCIVIKIYWGMFLRVQLTISADLIHWCMYVALGGDELIDGGWVMHIGMN